MSYANVVSIVEHVNYVIGIIVYLFLLYCLIFRSKQCLGTYRYLQIVMVTIDASYTTVQMFIHERIVTDISLFAMIPTSEYDISPEFLCIYLALYNLTFVMCDYSFLYRLWAIKSPLRIRFFSHPAFILLLCAIAALETLVWFSGAYFLFPPTRAGRQRLHEYALREFGVDTTEHVMIMGDYFQASLRNEDDSLNPVPVSGMILLCTVMAICFGFLIHAYSEIFHHLKEATLISKTSIRLQRQLFVTLCLQTIIPLICLYAPCALCIVMPPMRIDSILVARAIPLLISCFLPLDCLVVILSMADYRREVTRLLRSFSPSASVHALSNSQWTI